MDITAEEKIRVHDCHRMDEQVKSIIFVSIAQVSQRVQPGKSIRIPVPS